MPACCGPLAVGKNTNNGTELNFYYCLVTESHLPGCFNTLGSE